MATIQQLEKLHHIQRLFHVEDSLEAAVAGERVKLLIEKTEQLIRQRAFLREERRVLRISAEKLEERKQELALMNGKDWVPEQLRKLPPRCIQINIAGLVRARPAPCLSLLGLGANPNPNRVPALSPVCHPFAASNRPPCVPCPPLFRCSRCRKCT